MRVPRHAEKADQTVLLTLGVLKAQDCAPAKIDLHTVDIHMHQQADFAA